MTTDDPDDTDDLELRRWREDGKAPAGSCPYCASRISMVERDGFFRARCSHRGCGATGPKMRSITRAADLFCCPPQRTAAGMAISARPTTGTVGELLATAPVERRLCEQDIIVLRPNRTYIFTVDPSCAKCVELARVADPSTRGPIGEG